MKAITTVLVLLCIGSASVYAEEVVGTESNKPEAVDLGLPSGLKWASYNLGATSPEGYDGYYAWGETEPKDNYAWSNYKWCNGTLDKQVKYCTTAKYGTVDNKTTLDPEDDAAHAIWGGAWRMPTRSEMDELRNTCTWTWTTLNGTKGYKVTGPNGNSIFLPAAGYRRNTYLCDAESYGGYWSASLGESYSDVAYCLYLHPGARGTYDYNRCIGQSIRPVCE